MNLPLHIGFLGALEAGLIALLVGVLAYALWHWIMRAVGGTVAQTIGWAGVTAVVVAGGITGVSVSEEASGCGAAGSTDAFTSLTGGKGAGVFADGAPPSPEHAPSARTDMERSKLRKNAVRGMMPSL